MSIKNIFNTHITNMKEGIYFTIYKVSAELRINLRHFMTHFKSCTSKMKHSMSGDGQCLW